MNSKYLGDAKDFAKASVLGLWRPLTQGGGLKVVPLWTNTPTAGDLRTYARLIGRSIHDVVLGRKTFTNPNRTAYIRTALTRSGHAQTLFVDPDSGVRLNGTITQRHLTPSDLQVLLGTTPRVLIVYDESFSRTGVVLQQIRAKQRALRAMGIDCFYYDGMAVRLLVCANAGGNAHLLRMKAALVSHLRPAATHRVN